MSKLKCRRLHVCVARLKFKRPEFFFALYKNFLPTSIAIDPLTMPAGLTGMDASTTLLTNWSLVDSG